MVPQPYKPAPNVLNGPGSPTADVHPMVANTEVPAYRARPGPENRKARRAREAAERRK
jgi:hypothetical protein